MKSKTTKSKQLKKISPASDQVLSDPKAEMDGPWKYILSLLFQQFIELCFPEIATQIDWSEKVSLNTEFQKMVTDEKTKNTKTKKKITDLLFKVHMKNGQRTSVILHLETQGQTQKEDFPVRMVEYSLAISKNYKDPVLSIAILIDSDPNWRVDRYEKINPITNKPYFQFLFYMVKLLDYAPKLEQLNSEENIFALVLRAQLKVMETQWNSKTLKVAKREKQIKRFEDKKMFALELRSLLRKKKVSREQMNSLQKFLDCIIKLPEDLMIEYNTAVKQIAEDWEKTYVSTHEQVGRIEGRKEGLQEGIQKGEATFLSNLLKGRFPRAVTAKYLKMINSADSSTLSLWGKKLLNAKSIDDVFSGTRQLHG